MTQVTLERGRRNTVTAALGVDLSGRTLRSEIRARRSETAELIATWDITVTDVTAGDIELTLPPSALDGAPSRAWMDVIDVGPDETLMPAMQVSIIEGVTSG